MGRFGIPMMKKTRPELLEKMGEAMFEYVGECNKRNPTGEEGFNQLHLKYGYAHMPISAVRQICLDFFLALAGTQMTEDFA